MSVPDIFAPEFSVENPSGAVWDDHVSQGDPRVVGIVDTELAFSLTEEEIVKQILDCEQESEQARNSLEQDWWAWEDLYRMRNQSSEKQDWQADVIVPEVHARDRRVRHERLRDRRCASGSDW